MANIDSVTVQTDDAHVVILAHNRKRIVDADWEAGYLSHIRKMKESVKLDHAANLCFAEGSGPDAKQRATGNAIFDAKRGYRLRVAVVTDSIMVRGAVTAISWFNPLVHAYSPAHWSSAFEHVLFAPKDYRTVLVALQTLQSKVPDVGTLNEVIGLLARAG